MLIDLACTSILIFPSVVALRSMGSSRQLCTVFLIIVVLASIFMRAFFFRWVGVLRAVSGTEHLLIVKV